MIITRQKVIIHVMIAVPLSRIKGRKVALAAKIPLTKLAFTNSNTKKDKPSLFTSN